MNQFGDQFASQPGDSSGIPAQPPLPALDLRPLSTGELLDRVFFLYRSRILLFLVIALVPASLGLVSNGAQLLLPHAGAHRSGAQGSLAQATSNIGPSLAVLFSSLLVLAGYAISQAATTRLVTQIYLGGTGRPGKALRDAWPHTLRYIGIELWKAWSAIWLPLLFFVAAFAAATLRQPILGGIATFFGVAALVYGVIAYVRNSLAVPAAVVENLGMRASMRRTKALVDGRKGRIFLLYLLLMLLYVVAGVVQSPLLLLVAHTHRATQHAVALGLQLVLAFVIALLLSPVASIALCLFYFDERVRREAFDIDFLLRGSAAVLPTEAVPAGYPLQPDPQPEPQPDPPARENAAGSA